MGGLKDKVSKGDMFDKMGVGIRLMRYTEVVTHSTQKK
jgi:hypothetical protein